MRSIGVLSLLAALTACGDDLGAELAKCDLDAQKAFPSTSNFAVTLSERSSYSMKCMRAKGYAYDWNVSGCGAMLGGEACYRTVSRLPDVKLFGK